MQLCSLETLSHAMPPPTMIQATIESLFPRPSNMTNAELHQVLLEMIVTCNWPFNQFDVEVFRYLIRHGYPGHHIPRQKKAYRLLTSTAEKSRDEIKSRFENHEGRISLALDCWTSSNHWEFMGITPPGCSLIKSLNHPSMTTIRLQNRWSLTEVINRWIVILCHATYLSIAS